MSLKFKIQEDLTTALKNNREAELSALRMLLSSVGTKETEKRTKIWKGKSNLSSEELEKESCLTDEEIFDVISSEIKKRKEAIELYERGQRKELADKEKKEIEVLQKYLPEQLSEEEIRKLIKEAINKTEAKEQKDIGKVMGVVTPQLKGKADMGQVSGIVREFLAK